MTAEQQKPFYQPQPVDARAEADYSASVEELERLSRDSVFVRSLEAGDLDEVVRIDALATGTERRAYFEARFDEALNESGVRVSLVAADDGRPVGFVMAKVDFGEYGRTEPVAVIDTIGVDPTFAGRGVGRGLISQLLVNLAALDVDKVQTQVARENFDLLGFLYHCGFEPAQRLAFIKRLD